MRRLNLILHSFEPNLRRRRDVRPTGCHCFGIKENNKLKGGVKIKDWEWRMQNFHGDGEDRQNSPQNMKLTILTGWGGKGSLVF